MRLYLHIGSHKTGTTALQHFAALNRDLLLDRGLHYPRMEPWGPDLPNQMPVVGGMFGLAGVNDLTPDQIDDFFTSTRSTAAEHGSDVLLSAENIFRLTHEQRDDLYHRLRSAFPDFEIVAVIALRRQDNLADSLYRTVVRGQTRPKRTPPTWPEFLESRAKLFDYWSIVSQAWSGLGGRPILIPYGGSVQQQIIPAFFDALRIDITGSQQLKKRVNVSYDYVDCRVKFILHDLDVADQTFRHYDKYVEANPSRTPYSFFGAEDRTDLLASHAEGNAALCSDYPELASLLGKNSHPDYAVEPGENAALEIEHRFLGFYRYLSRDGGAAGIAWAERPAGRLWRLTEARHRLLKRSPRLGTWARLARR